MSDPSKKPLKWNEENLRENERIQADILKNMADKNQVIDEPKTPYRQESDDDEPHDEVFEHKLHDALHRKEWGESDDDEDEQFKKKRAQHYNEYRVLQRMRQSKKEQQDEEDGVDDDEIQKMIQESSNIVVKSNDDQ